jgi:Family of unknown function (DUF5335)
MVPAPRTCRNFPSPMTSFPSCGATFNMSRHLSDIQPDDWSVFLDKLNRENRGRIVSIEVNTSDPSNCMHVQDVPFEGLSLALQGNEETISIVVREQALQHMVHTVRLPLHMVYEQDGNVARSLLIESEDGGTATVKFRAVSIPETVQAQTLDEPR